MSARALMLVGTASHVGKSVLTTALCRIMAQDGVRVAPFKAQNLSLNAAVTPDGLEIGRAQAVQAEAAGIVPTADMNPILLKPMGGGRSQLVLQGTTVGTHTFNERAGADSDLWGRVRQSLAALQSAYDVVIIEGAGSPVELNLRALDLANMRVAEAADARVLLVADIDRGGVFAAVHGTLGLLPAPERARVVGIVVNRFRGEPRRFADGVRLLERLARRPVLGVVPYVERLGIDEEDGMGLWSPRYRPVRGRVADALRIAVVALPHLANFTDFDPLFAMGGVDAYLCTRSDALASPHLIILPGTKDTLGDLDWLWREGFAHRIVAHHAHGGHVLGICGGYQMLGQRVRDPLHVESQRTEVAGLGLVDARTTLGPGKHTQQVAGTVCSLFPGIPIAGYEMHMGETQVGEGATPLARVRANGCRQAHDDGQVAAGGRVVGTYLHGILEGDAFRRRYVDWLRDTLALGAAGGPAAPGFSRAAAYDRLAAVVRRAVDMARVYSLLGHPH